MRFTFGRFELDGTGRTLRLDGRDQALQPLVFDLLVYLVKNRERVVAKDELLSELWSGVTVTDGSLQRAVSLLRTVLREGGAPDAVQTFARRGYRFCETPPAAPARSESPPAPSEGRELAAAGHWGRALALFESRSDHDALAAEDWEAWGSAAVCAGKLVESVAPLERAVVAFEERGDREGAARAALLLTNVKLELREMPIAKGWHQRALNHLRDLRECKQHGMAEWLGGRIALFESRLDACDGHAESALQIAQRVDDIDVRCLGLVYRGHVLIAQGAIQQGLAFHDEAGVLAMAGKAGDWASGVVFCSVIWAYLHLGDHFRASQWTDEFERWCRRHPAYAFPALCRLHRGEVLAARGDLAGAEIEVHLARDALAASGPYVEGDAWRVLGDINLARGDLDAAEAAFRESYRLGWSPQPGFAQLLAARGQDAAAIKQLELALAQPGWTDGQRRRILLAVLARIAAISGNVERARSALDATEGLPPTSLTLAALAETARARGELAWAERDSARAEPAMRESVAAWLEAGSPVNAAHVRLRLCELMIAIGDTTSAELELSAAEAVFRDLGAVAVLARCGILRGGMGLG